MKIFQIYSPNYSNKIRSFKHIKHIIVHYTGMQSEIVSIKRLTDPKSKVSCHYFINRKGRIFQMVQDKLVWMLNEITKAQLLALHVGRNKDNGSLKHQQVSMIKKNNVWCARECAKLAREILGANGITDDYPIMRHMMNIESVYTYEGTNEMHTLILGQDLTDIPAFK